jgi:hypothetical protein
MLEFESASKLMGGVWAIISCTPSTSASERQKYCSDSEGAQTTRLAEVRGLPASERRRIAIRMYQTCIFGG